jgi:hypothetical protein
MGCADTSTEKTWLSLCLEEVHKHLSPPELECVAGNIVRETAEQRLVLSVAAYVSEENCDGPSAERYELIE